MWNPEFLHCRYVVWCSVDSLFKLAFIYFFCYYVLRLTSKWHSLNLHHFSHLICLFEGCRHRDCKPVHMFFLSDSFCNFFFISVTTHSLTFLQLSIPLWVATVEWTAYQPFSLKHICSLHEESDLFESLPDSFYWFKTLLCIVMSPITILYQS